MHENKIPGKIRFAEKIKPYKKDFDYSYTLGAFPTFELIKSRPDIVRGVVVHSSFPDRGYLEVLCTHSHIPVTTDDKILTRISPKENCYAAAVFEKFGDNLRVDRDHVVLVNPGDMGNLGAIVRTLAGFGINDLGIISPSADIFHPKVVRSSMGALFKMRFQVFPSFDEYRTMHASHDVFPFLLRGKVLLGMPDCPKSALYALVFGNEAAGLDAAFENIGTGIRIPQTADIDSQNLTIAVGIGVFAFTAANPR
jgi:TrmH family RNA methyltransferase